MGAKRIEIQFDVVDKSSAKLQTADNKLKKLGATTDQTRKKTAQYDAVNRKAARGLDGFRLSTTALTTSITALAGATGISRLTRITAGFERGMSGVRAVTQAVGRDFVALRDRARELGATTEFTATQAANGMRFLGQAGFDTREILDAIGPSLDLATAGQISLAESADIASNVLSGFQLEARESQRVMDVLAQTAASANTNITQLGDAMSYVAPVSAAANVSIEDTAAAVGVLSNAGIQATRAGTGLRLIISKLVDPTEDGRAAIEELGLSLADLDPRTNRLIDIFGRLNDAQIGLTEANRIFEVRQGAAALTLAKSVESFAELTEKTNNAEGALSKMANTIRSDIQGDLDTLKSAIEETFLVIADRGVGDSLRNTIQGFTEGFRDFAKSNALGIIAKGLSTMVSNLDLIAKIGGTLVAIKLASLFGNFARSTNTAARSLTLMSGRLTLARARVIALLGPIRLLRGGLAALGGPAGLAFLAAEGMFFLATKTRDANTEMVALANSTEKIGARFSAQFAEMNDLQVYSAVNAINDQRALIEADITIAESKIRALQGARDNFDIKASRELQGLGFTINTPEDISGFIAKLENQIDGFNAKLGNLNERKVAAAERLGQLHPIEDAPPGFQIPATRPPNGLLDRSQGLAEQLAKLRRDDAALRAIEQRRVTLGPKSGGITSGDATSLQLERQREILEVTREKLELDRSILLGREQDNDALERSRALYEQQLDIESQLANLPKLERLNQEIEAKERLAQIAEQELAIEQSISTLSASRLDRTKSALGNLGGLQSGFAGVLNNSGQQRVDSLNDNLSRLQTQEATAQGDKLTNIQSEISKTRVEIESAEFDSRLELASGFTGAYAATFSQLYTQLGSEHEEFLYAWKAFAIFQTTVDTARAVVSTLASAASFPGGAFIAPALAASIGALGAIQIGLIAASDVPTFHTGGVVGLGPDEQYIKAQTGEGIVSRRGMEFLEAINSANLPGGMGGTQVNIYDQRESGEDIIVEESVDERGQSQLSIIVRDAVRQQFESGQHDRSLRRRYGLTPKSVGR